MGRDVPDVLWGTESTAITLRAGSITSTSATGLTMPYGGVSDGIEYRYNGGVVEFSDPLDVQVASPNGEIKPLGIIFGNSSVAAEAGSVIDLSGGGQLLGAGFVSGRGGSVDILRQALSSANPAYGTNGGDGIYAIVPTGSAAYAPIAPDVGAGDPRVGQTITLTRKTGNLPAGTYVLLPSIYALLPGAYRIELGTSSAVDSDNVAQHSGSFVSQGYLGSPVAGLRDALPTSFVLTPADAVRTLSRYDETDAGKFVRRAETSGRTGCADSPVQSSAHRHNLRFQG